MSEDRSIVFRSLREADLPLLTRWLAQAHVREWWGGDEPPPSIEDARAKYLPRMDAASPIRCYIALIDDEPIGFVQSYVVRGCGDGWWEDETDPGAIGIDQFLCDGRRLGQGLGTRVVRAFVQRLLAEPGVTKVQTDPDPANVRAIRCYEKAGFRRLGTVTTLDGPALLMVVEKNPGQAGT